MQSRHQPDVGVESPPTPRGTKPTKPYAWWNKGATRLIRQLAEVDYTSQVLAVYMTHCELASNKEGDTYTVPISEIMAMSGVGRTRVNACHGWLKKLRLLTWKNSFIEGTKELGNNSYTLLAVSTGGSASERRSSASEQGSSQPQNGACGRNTEGTGKELPERTVETETVSARSVKEWAKEIAAKHRVNSDSDSEYLLDQCAQWLGKGEMDRSSRYWQAVARNNPEELSEALGELRYLINTNSAPKNRGAFVNAELKKRKAQNPPAKTNGGTPISPSAGQTPTHKSTQ